MDDFPVVSRAEAQAQARDSLVRNLRAALDDAEELVRLTAEHAGEQVGVARDRARASLVRARADLERAQLEAMRQTRMAAREVDDYVHTKPWNAIVLAGVVSAVIGVLISRR